ncbi:pyroglutamyl-peptidase I [bacterium]|nr:pyroglutamyl-peptidase I [candidate division CSSED10-310 bacterium]
MKRYTKRLLLTAFKPFLSYRLNSSQILLESYTNIHFSDIEIDRRIIGVTYRECEETVKTLKKETDLLAVLMFGMRVSSRTIDLESCARNIQNSRHPDQDGVEAKDMIIEPGGPDLRWSNLPLKTLSNSLIKKGLPCRISHNAGTYVCNSLFYRMLILTEDMDVPVGFIHLPLISQSWKLQRLQMVLDTIIETLYLKLPTKTGH